MEVTRTDKIDTIEVSQVSFQLYTNIYLSHRDKKLMCYLIGVAELFVVVAVGIKDDKKNS